ncbi:triose-phosphate isomerase [Candidatus Enterococcus ferrettii]|uniref:Triosephosphate isomerase (TIM) n=1 Tax=Candidatus Enterococcus ferrettii TaxID=2815324 RepID=A0ABV0EP41_9ENTE|nr:triose-phosphate isomerase [Enterococcus sp. 665A]MBO1338189.1 triose-phosphate isomerase [Enterococcus sp. 665A]
MKREQITPPFFTVSPKSYLVGNELIELAKMTDELAEKHESSIFFVAPAAELVNIVQNTEHVIVTAQTADANGLGRGMGRTPLESLKANGVEATFLNHMEHPLTIKELSTTIKRAKELGIITIACADTPEESAAIATLDPDIILCEPDCLVGTGTVSDESYIAETIAAVRAVNSEILIMEGAGITCGKDVRRLLKLGAQGTGISSTLALAENKNELLTDLLGALR